MKRGGARVGAYLRLRLVVTRDEVLRRQSYPGAIPKGNKK